MTSIKSVIVFLSILILCFLTNTTSLANDAPVNLKSGGLNVLAGMTAYISMEKEVVKIVLGKESYIVDATFTFLNTGDTVNIDVGFPKRGSGWLGDDFHQASDFIKFETWVNGKPVKFVEAAGTSHIEGNYTFPSLVAYIKQTNTLNDLKGLWIKDDRWMVKENITFPANKITTTRVYYEAPYQEGGECKWLATYIYGTGLYWGGDIGESKFIVDATSIPKDDRPKNISFVAEKDKSHIKCKTFSDGITQCVITNYKPATEDASIVIGIGCPD
jgi:hypothetical protein